MEDDQNENIKPKGIGKKIGASLRKFRKKTTKNAVNAGIDARKVMWKSLLAGLLLILKISIPIIILMGAFWLGSEISNSNVASSATTSYYSSSMSGSYPARVNTIYESTDQKTAADAGEVFYTKTGSLLLSVNKDIHAMTDTYLDSIKNSMNGLYQVLVKDGKIGDYQISDISYASELGIRNAYDFLLNAEKLNFNRIKWISYSYNASSGTTSSKELSLSNGLTRDKQTGLIYPSDAGDNKELLDFATMTRPYLQSWVIPMSMFTGNMTDTSNNYLTNYIYRIINDAYHKIVIEQHTIRQVEKNRTKLKYITNSTEIPVYTVVTSVTCSEKYIDIREREVTRTCDDGKEKEKTEYYVLKKDLEALYESYDTAYKGADEKELSYSQVVDLAGGYTARKDTSDIKYVISNVETFDTVLQSKYEVVRFTNTDLNNFVNESLSQVVGSKPYHNSYFDDSNIHLVDSLPEESQSSETKGDIEDEITVTTIVTVSSNGTTGVTINSGEYETMLYRWEDSFKAVKRISRRYSLDDVISYVNSDEIVNSLDENFEVKGMVVPTSYYNALASNNELNRLDLINANPSIFKDYVAGDAYAVNVGLGRSSLETSYYLLKRHLGNLKSDFKVSVKYGNSILSGVDTTQEIVDYDYSYLLEDELAWPVPNSGYMTSKFGSRYIEGRVSTHNGIDIGRGEGWTNYLGNSSKDAYYIGPDIVAAADGKIIEIQTNEECNDVGGYGVSCGNYGPYVKHGQFGRHVVIETNTGLVIIYGHMYGIVDSLEVGDEVKRGQIIGAMGSTGSSTGTHLHFEIRDSNGAAVNPEDYISEESKP